jgi:hypothetical protein
MHPAGDTSTRLPAAGRRWSSGPLVVGQAEGEGLGEPGLLDMWQRGELAPPWRAHVGMLLIGWGAFNIVEGLVDHQLLDIHHVRDDLGAPLTWDLGCLAFGGGAGRGRPRPEPNS